MIKVFTLNKNGKIELTEEEIKKLLDEAYWEGYHANKTTYWYTTPNYPYTPYYYTTTASSDSSITISNATTADTIA